MSLIRRIKISFEMLGSKCLRRTEVSSIWWWLNRSVWKPREEQRVRHMWEVGWTNSGRGREVELNTRQKMRKVFTKEIVASQALVNVKFNGILKLLKQSKFGGLTLFRDGNQDRVDTVLVTVEH
jgi:hypothetical protein